MTAALRKAAERRRRAARGEVALSGWLSASDHAALTQMARDSGMTQGQVVSRLIEMAFRDAPVAWLTSGGDVTRSEAYAVEQSVSDLVNYPKALGFIMRPVSPEHSDLTAAIGLNAAKAGNEGEG